MALQFSASIYRINSADLNSGTRIPATMGIPHSFPSQGVRSYPVTGTVTANGAAMNSIIALLPQGLNQPEKLFYTPLTVAQIVTAANA